MESDKIVKCRFCGSRIPEYETFRGIDDAKACAICEKKLREFNFDRAIFLKLLEVVPEFRPVADTGDPKKILAFVSLLQYNPKIELDAVKKFCEIHCPQGAAWPFGNCQGCEHFGNEKYPLRGCCHPKHPGMIIAKRLEYLQFNERKGCQPPMDKCKICNRPIPSGEEYCSQSCRGADEASPEDIEAGAEYYDKLTSRRPRVMMCPACNKKSVIFENDGGQQKCECGVVIYAKADGEA